MANIVIVDDEPLLLKVMGKMVQSMGFTVSSFSNPNDALEYIEDNGEECALIIVDKNMPEMNGILMAETIKKMIVTTPLLLSTGESDALEMDDELFELFSGVIQKPYQKSQLEDIIHTILEQK